MFTSESLSSSTSATDVLPVFQWEPFCLPVCTEASGISGKNSSRACNVTLLWCAWRQSVTSKQVHGETFVQAYLRSFLATSQMECQWALSTILLVPTSSSRKTSDRSSGLLRIQKILKILSQNVQTPTVCFTSAIFMGSGGVETQEEVPALCITLQRSLPFVQIVPGLRNCVEPFAEFNCIPLRKWDMTLDLLENTAKECSTAICWIHWLHLVAFFNQDYLMFLCFLDFLDFLDSFTQLKLWKWGHILQKLQGLRCSECKFDAIETPHKLPAVKTFTTLWRPTRNCSMVMNLC